MKTLIAGLTSQERAVLIFLIVISLLGLGINISFKYFPSLKNFVHNVFSEYNKTAYLKVNINQASADTFTNLPGIGPAIAKRIVEYREKNGRFSSIQELSYVNGIGEKKVRQLEGFLTLN